MRSSNLDAKTGQLSEIGIDRKRVISLRNLSQFSNSLKGQAGLRVRNPQEIQGLKGFSQFGSFGYV